MANTIAFGGVATGNMNANEAAITPGSIRYNGCRLISRASTDRMGSNREEVAVFEVNSVSPATRSATITTINQLGREDMDSRRLPMYLLRPDTWTGCVRMGVVREGVTVIVLLLGAG